MDFGFNFQFSWSLCTQMQLLLPSFSLIFFAFEFNTCYSRFFDNYADSRGGSIGYYFIYKFKVDTVLAIGFMYGFMVPIITLFWIHSFKIELIIIESMVR